MKTIVWISLIAGCAGGEGGGGDDGTMYGGDDDGLVGDADADADTDADGDTDSDTDVDVDADSDADEEGPQPEHGSGDCGSGGIGDPDDFSHVPTCPSDARRWQERYQASRSVYYGDGLHVFEPQFVNWDDEIADVAQAYADEYAGGMSPNGQIYSDIQFESFWYGEYEGYTAIAGMETPTSCDCEEGEAVGPFESGGATSVFYAQGGAYFRTHVIRLNGMSRMGVGHVATGDGSHYWAILFAP